MGGRVVRGKGLGPEHRLGRFTWGRRGTSFLEPREKRKDVWKFISVRINLVMLQ